MTRKYHLITYGCQMNTADSEAIAGTLEKGGMVATDDLLQADLVVINSCSVRQAAEDSVYGLARRITLLREHKPHSKVILTGCMVGSTKGERKRFRQEILHQKAPWINDFIETADLLQATKIMAQPKRAEGPHAFVNISTGCDNFCTYCVVPYARGKEVSRPKTDIMTEITDLVREGYNHITLLGQNVNSWGIADQTQKLSIRTNSKEKLPFARLLREIHEIDEVRKISFISSNPFDFTMDLVETLELSKIDRFLHLPVQAGDNEILKQMNRRHTREEYLQLLENIRRVVPDIKISTDLIVGFPGETEEQFQKTVALCEKARFSLAFISIYSERPGTNAAKFFKDNISLTEKKRRHKILTEVVKRNKLREDPQP